VVRPDHPAAARRGSERARTAAVAQEVFITCLGLASIGTWIFAFDGFAQVAPLGGFIFADSFMSACAVGGLLSATAREFCHPRAACPAL
jgi:hypothetical protein